MQDNCTSKDKEAKQDQNLPKDVNSDWQYPNSNFILKLSGEDTKKSSGYLYLSETSWLISMRPEFQLLIIILRLLFPLQKIFKFNDRF